MKSKWAAGICPRNFHWIMKDRLAVCERLGGYGESHRRVRRTEEITWVAQQGFNRIVSLIPGSHNLHNYSEKNTPWVHWPIADNDVYETRLVPLFIELRTLLAAGEKLLIHRRSLDDTVCGFMAGYLLWAGMVPDEPRAIVVVEKMTGRPIGSKGRHMVSIAARLPADRRSDESEESTDSAKGHLSAVEPSDE